MVCNPHVRRLKQGQVEMIKDMVTYFLRQGDYSQPGDIAVLCAYLGQLQKVRHALKDLQVTVALDERDAAQLARQEPQTAGGHQPRTTTERPKAVTALQQVRKRS